MVQRVGRAIALIFHDHGTRRGEWPASRPGRTLPLGKTRYPLYRRLGGPQGRSGLEENVASTGIRSPDRPARSSVTIPTELPGPQCIEKYTDKIINIISITLVNFNFVY